MEISFNNIQDSPIAIDDSSELNLIDENGNVGLKVNNEGLFVKDVITSNHKLSDKADVIDIPTHTSQLINDSDFITKTNVESTIDEISSDIETIENIIEENAIDGGLTIELDFKVSGVTDFSKALISCLSKQNDGTIQTGF